MDARIEALAQAVVGAVLCAGFAIVAAPAVNYIDDPDAGPAVKSWYAHVYRSDYYDPRSPNSCCGEGDAYWADEGYVRDGKFYAVITDKRTVPGRKPVAAGTAFAIPDAVLDSHFQGNPTGHAVVFLASGEYPICYFFGTGG